MKEPKKNKTIYHSGIQVLTTHYMKQLNMYFFIVGKYHSERNQLYWLLVKRLYRCQFAEFPSLEMEEKAQEKSRGSTFAEQQLLRHGWEQGKGLGRQENGISEAIKVKVKCGKGGVGHNEGEQFTFHWWDHVFNKASASLQVESDQNGVSVKKIVEEEEDGMISNKKPRKASLAKAKLYGCFVKSATLLSGQEQPEPKSSHTDDSSSSSDDEDQKLDLSSTTMLSDADLMKVCGGRTAHKGARHGLTMSAKLARLEQQEAEFMAKYGKKSKSISCSPKCTTPTTQSAAQSPERQEKEILETQKTRSSSEEMYGNSMSINGATVTDSHEVDSNKSRKKKKKKKNRSDDCNGEMTPIIPTEEELKLEENGTAGQPQIIKRKHKKSKKNNITIPTAEAESVVEEVLSEQQSQKNKTKRKKSKSSKKCERPVEPEEEEQINGADSSRAESAQHPVPKKKRNAINMEEVSNECKDDKQTLQNGVSDVSMPPKKKKKKKCKDERSKPDKDN